MNLGKLQRGFNKIGFKVKKHAPAILMATGTVGVVGTVVLTAKATTKCQEIMAEHKANMDTAKSCLENKELIEAGKYSEEDYKKDITTFYGQTGLAMAKEVAPVVALGAFSIGCFFGAYKIVNGRYLATSAALTATTASLKGYRERVAEKYGEEIENQLYYGIKCKELEVVEVNEDGTETVKVVTEETVDPASMYSPYAKFFDVGNDNWEKDSEYNRMFLESQQRYANNLLRSRGYLYLNEVYRALGITETKAGQVVGWIYDEENPIGDNYVDFGLYANNQASRNFINGDERSILLDFNVDGNIWELMA